MPRKNVFVTIDGCNGVGKTTICKAISDLLQEDGINCFITSEPTHSPIGLLIREVEATLDRTAFASLVAADRYWHITNEIMPMLTNDYTVLSARYVESSLVLQRLDGIPIDFIWNLNSLIKKPDLSIILDAGVQVIEERLKNRGELSFYERKYKVEKEKEYYLDAARYLQQQGFNVRIIRNECISIAAISEKIKTLILDLTDR